MKYHGGHVVISFDWDGQDWWKPSAYAIREDYTDTGAPYAWSIGFLGVGLFFILYRRLPPLNNLEHP